MKHLDNRLMSRVKPHHLDVADRLINASHNYLSAAIVASVDKVSKSKSNDGSNGDNLALIVRNGYAVTIMYTRNSQLNLNHLRVDRIVRI